MTIKSELNTQLQLLSGSRRWNQSRFSIEYPWWLIKQDEDRTDRLLVYIHINTHIDTEKKFARLKTFHMTRESFDVHPSLHTLTTPPVPPLSPLTFTFLTVHLPFDLPSQPPWKQLPIYSRDWIWGREKSQQSKAGIYLFRPQTREYKALATFMMPSRKNIHKYWLCLGDIKEWSPPFSFLYSFYF